MRIEENDPCDKRVNSWLNIYLHRSSPREKLRRIVDIPGEALLLQEKDSYRVRIGFMEFDVPILKI